jgi:hypothetical protein
MESAIESTPRKGSKRTPLSMAGVSDRESQRLSRGVLVAAISAERAKLAKSHARLGR